MKVDVTLKRKRRYCNIARRKVREICRAVVERVETKTRELAATFTCAHTLAAFAGILYVRVIKHFACEGIIVGVGPCAVYTVLLGRGAARDGGGYVV